MHSGSIYPWPMQLWVVLFGLAVGSFLNVCIYRLPLGQSVVTPRSHCPQCGRFIRWSDNIPLLSFFLLWGRCRWCKKTISPRYPFVEALTGLFSLFTYLKFPDLPSYLSLFLLLVAPLIAITFIDLQHRIIPNLLTIPGIGAGIVTGLVTGSGSPLDRLIFSILGAVAGGVALFTVSWVYEKVRGREGIGMGDVKMVAMLGAFFGWKGVFLTLFFSSFLGSAAGVVLILFLGKGLKYEIPYGPFIATAALLNLFFGPELVSFYLNLTSLFHHNYN